MFMKYCCTCRDKKGTCYFEFMAGKFKNEHWNDNSIFIHADIFDELKLINVFLEIVPHFEYYYITEVSFDEWSRIVLLANQKGGAVAEAVNELDLWAAEIKKTENCITICGI